MDYQLCRLLELLRTIPDTAFEDEEEDEDEYEEEEDEGEEEIEEKCEEENEEKREEKAEGAVNKALHNQMAKKKNGSEDKASQDNKQEEKTDKSSASEYEKEEGVSKIEHVQNLNPAQKAIVRNFDLPKIFPGLDLKTNSNFLLYGPGGTGKSTLAKFIAEVANAELVHIEVRQVLSKYHGESEALLGEQFDMASSRAENGQNTVLFFDEVGYRKLFDLLFL